MNIPKLLALAGGLLLAPLAHAVSHPELERIAPVPDDQPIPLIDFCRPWLFIEPTLNRAGTRIAALVNTDDDFHAAIIYDVATGKFEKIGGLRESSIFELFWVNDDRLLLWSGFKQSAEVALLVADIRDGKPDLNTLAYSSYLTVVGAPDGRREMPIMDVRGGYMDGIKVHRQAVVINTQGHLKGPWDRRDAFTSGKFPFGVAAAIVDSYPKPPGDNVGRYIVDTKEELAYATTFTKGVGSLYRWTGKDWVKREIDLDRYNFLSVDVDPEKLLVSEITYDGVKRSIRLWDSVKNEFSEPLLQDPKYDMDRAWVSRDRITKQVLGIHYTKSAPAVVWLDAGYKGIQSVLDKMFQGSLVSIVESDLKHEKFLVLVRSDRDPGMYAFVDLAAKKVTPIKSRAPWFDPKRMNPMQVMAYKSRDGHRIEAYLTLPKGASKATPAPLVVMPHGGPWARDSWGFDIEAQLLSSQGYAVLQPNYRGSTDNQSEFSHRENYDFRHMSDDVTDGVRALIKTGLVDPKRVGIMGGSFGGYLAVAGIAFERDLYRCAVTMAGVFDWAALVREDGRNSDDLGNTEAWFKKHVGDPAVEKERYQNMSPLFHLDGVKVPVFVTHGRDDQRVPIEQSKDLLDQLDKNHVPYEKYFMFDEGHGVGIIDHRLEYYKRILAFLEKKLKNAK